MDLMYCCKLCRIKELQVEAVVTCVDEARARALQKHLGFGRVRKHQVHVGMGDLPALLGEDSNRPDEARYNLWNAAVELERTLTGPKEVVHQGDRLAAIEKLSSCYQCVVSGL